jgi:hypothetical protein
MRVLLAGHIIPVDLTSAGAEMAARQAAKYGRHDWA